MDSRPFSWASEGNTPWGVLLTGVSGYHDMVREQSLEAQRMSLCEMQSRHRSGRMGTLSQLTCTLHFLQNGRLTWKLSYSKVSQGLSCTPEFCGLEFNLKLVYLTIPDEKKKEPKEHTWKISRIMNGRVRWPHPLMPVVILRSFVKRALHT